MRDPMSLYPVADPMEKQRGMMQGAASSFGAMGQNRNTTSEAGTAGKTAGGGIMAGIGGAAAGYMMAGSVAGATGVGSAATGLAALGLTGVGAPLAIAGLALGAYFLS